MNSNQANRFALCVAGVMMAGVVLLMLLLLPQFIW